MTEDNKSLLNSTRRAILKGALFSVTSGALAKAVSILASIKVINIVLGKVNIIISMLSATRILSLVKNLAFLLNKLNKATLFMKFATKV